MRTVGISTVGISLALLHSGPLHGPVVHHGLLRVPEPSASILVPPPLAEPEVLVPDQAVPMLPVLPVLPPQLTADALWATLDGHCGHLDVTDRENLRGALDVLLKKAALAVRALQLPLGALPLAVELGPEVPQELEVLSILSSLRTARDLLDLRLDAPTVAAALLSEVLSERTPTWPASPLPDSFKLEVTALLSQSQSMQLLQAAVPDLSDQHAFQVRGALMAAVQCDTEPLDDECTVASPAPPTASQDPRADPRALLVLMGSTLTALRARDVRPASQQRALALAAIQLYAPLAHSVGFGAAFAELEHLAYTNLFPEQLRRLQRWYAMVWPDAPTQLAQFRSSLEGQLRSSTALSGLVVNLAVLGRVKTVTSTFRKLLRDQMPVEQVDAYM